MVRTDSAARPKLSRETASSLHSLLTGVDKKVYVALTVGAASCNSMKMNYITVILAEQKQRFVVFFFFFFFLLLLILLKSSPREGDNQRLSGKNLNLLVPATGTSTTSSQSASTPLPHRL